MDDGVRIMKAFAVSAALISSAIVHAAPDWENQAVFRIHKEEPRAISMPFPTADGALSKKRLESPWCMMLNGDWKFHWVNHPDKRPTDFFRTSFDDSSWKTIPVPSNVELHGYGTVIGTGNAVMEWNLEKAGRQLAA